MWRKRPICIFVLSMPHLPAEKVAELDALDSEQARLYRKVGRTRVAGDLPSWRASGPLLAQAYQLGVEWQNRLKTQPAHFYPVHG